MADELKHVTIYTDGACEPNPGPGGYGAVLIYGDVKKELSGGFRLTTNNRMELYAAIRGLEALKEPCNVTLYSDSKYVVDPMAAGSAKRWRENDWWRTRTKRAVSTDLWARLLDLTEKHQVRFLWVKGHDGNLYNERCDALSYAVIAQGDLPPDEGYESRSETKVDLPSADGVLVSGDHDIARERIGGREKITQEGQPCRKCLNPVIRKVPRQKPSTRRAFYYEYYLYCSKCRTMYMVDEAKRFLDQPRLP